MSGPCVCAAEGRAVRPAYAQISTVIIALISAERSKAKRQTQKHRETLWMRFNRVDVSLSSILWCNQRNAAIERRRRQKNQCGLPTNPLGSRPAKVIICGPQITKANRQIKAQRRLHVCVFMADAGDDVGWVRPLRDTSVCSVQRDAHPLITVLN